MSNLYIFLTLNKQLGLKLIYKLFTLQRQHKVKNYFHKNKRKIAYEQAINYFYKFSRTVLENALLFFIPCREVKSRAMMQLRNMQWAHNLLLLKPVC
jgi:hypothetical protein